MILKQSILHSRIVSLQTSLHLQKDYLFCLIKRLQLMKIDLIEKSSYEINEIEILRYKTLVEISKVTQSINAKQHGFNQELNNYLYSVNDVENNFDSLIAKAKKESSIDVKHILHEANWKTMDENIEEKISFYNQLEQRLVK